MLSGRDCSEVWSAERRVWITERRRVEKVKEFRAKLKTAAFHQPKVLEQGKINIVESRTIEQVASCIAVGIDRSRKCGSTDTVRQMAISAVGTCRPRARMRIALSLA